MYKIVKLSNTFYNKDIRGIYNMVVKIRKIGDSFVSSLPKEAISKTKFKENCFAEVVVQDEETIVLKLKDKPKKYLETLFENYNGNDNPKEFSWEDNSPVGNEVW